MVERWQEENRHCDTCIGSSSRWRKVSSIMSPVTSSSWLVGWPRHCNCIHHLTAHASRTLTRVGELGGGILVQGLLPACRLQQHGADRWNAVCTVTMTYIWRNVLRMEYDLCVVRRWWRSTRDLRSFVIRFDFESYVRFEIRFVLMVRFEIFESSALSIVIRKETIGGG